MAARQALEWKAALAAEWLNFRTNPHIKVHEINKEVRICDQVVQQMSVEACELDCINFFLLGTRATAYQAKKKDVDIDIIAS